MLAFSAFFDKNVGSLAGSFMSENTIADFSLPSTGKRKLKKNECGDLYS